MGTYDIGFIFFCVIMLCFIFIGISKNILTGHGVGLLIAILVLGIIGYDLWVTFQVQEAMNQIELAPSQAEKEMLIQELMRKIGTLPRN
jgi:hypothetical protein